MKYASYLLIAILFFVFSISARGNENLDYSEDFLTKTIHSNDNEELLVTIMLAQQYKPSLVPELITNIESKAVTSILTKQLAVYYCQNKSATSFCKENNYLTKLALSDSENIEPYLYLFIKNYQEQQWQDAFYYLGEGLTKPETNSYYLDKLEMAREVLKSNGFRKDKVNTTSESIALSIYPYYYGKLLSYCPKVAKTSVEWRSLCLRLGKRLENSSNTILATMVGFGIQRDIYKQSNIKSDLILFEETMSRRAKYMSVRSQFKEKFNTLLNADNRPESFYTLMMEKGEFAVLQHYLENH